MNENQLSSTSQSGLCRRLARADYILSRRIERGNIVTKLIFSRIFIVGLGAGFKLAGSSE